MARKTGRCLCGSVTFEAEIQEMSATACHCGQCRRWTSGPMLGVHAHGEVTYAGAEKIRAYQSSDYGERGFCTECGSTLFWRFQGGGETILALGAFNDQSSASLDLEIFVDEQPGSYAFEGERKRMIGAEVIAAAQAQSDAADDGSQ